MQLARLMERTPTEPEDIHKLNYVLAGGVLVGHVDGKGLGERELQCLVDMLIHKGGLAFETILSSDIQLNTVNATYGQQHGGTEWNVSYTHNTYGIDYEPYALFDFLGFAERLDEALDRGQVLLRQKLGDRFTLSGGGGIYSGFTDYRSLWLANYYRQQFNFVPGYQSPDPRGFNVSTGLRWEYQPTTGFAEANFFYAHDEIAPGYEFEPLLGQAVHGRDRLHTYAPSLKFENVLTKRIRTLNEFQFTLTTQTGRTYRVEISTNLLNWTTLRSVTGAATPMLFRETNAPPTRRFYRAVTP